MPGKKVLTVLFEYEGEPKQIKEIFENFNACCDEQTRQKLNPSVAALATTNLFEELEKAESNND